MIHARRPDVILLGGDIFDIRLDSLSTFNMLSELSKTYPTYFVTGNHEYDIEALGDLLNQLQVIGVQVLKNESVPLNDEIMLHGVDDLLSKHKQVMVIPENDKYNIVLVHRPHLFDQYVSQGVDLVLSGHVHGGQWAIPYLLNGLIAPDQGLFPKYGGGYYEHDNSKMIISRGLSRDSEFIFRFYNPYELVMIEVEHE